jgi:hypothetical protein
MGNTVTQMPNVQVTVSGSFRRAMAAVQDVVEEIVDAGAFVLSPADPRIVDQFGDFVFVASDRIRHIRSVQGRHLAAIAASDFLWLVAPDGYVGQSAAMEIGYAAACEIPVYSDEVPSDLTLRQWVNTAPSAAAVIRQLGEARAGAPGPAGPQAPGSLLLDPARGIEAAHDDLLIARQGLLLGAPGPLDTEMAKLALGRIHSRTALP